MTGRHPLANESSNSQLDDSASGDRRAFWFGMLILQLTLVGLLAWTWRRWPELFVDFGRELYVAWRLADGAVLYRDIVYFNGPLSPMWNGLLFQLFGVSFTTVIVANTLLLSAVVATLYRLLTRVVSTTTAMLSCLSFLVLFAFSHTLPTGNYNYISPYSHEMTHGIALTTFMIGLLFSSHSGRWYASLLVGCLWSGVTLGKAELTLAATGALVATIVLQSITEKYHWWRVTSRILWLLLGAAIPIGGFYLSLRKNLTHTETITGLLGTWHWIFNSDVAGHTFYEKVAGTNAPWLNLSKMVRATVAVFLAVATATFLDRWIKSKNNRPLVWALICIAALVVSTGRTSPLLLHGRSMTILAVVLFGGALWWRWKAKPQQQVVANLVLAWCVWGGLLLAKFPLRPGIGHYGFALAMPLVILLIAIALEWVPRLTCTAGGLTCRLILALMLLLDMLGSAARTSTHISQKRVTVGTGYDVVLSSESHGALLAQTTIKFLQEHTDSRATVTVLPEGAMINYLARRPGSTPHVNLMPSEVAMSGETRIRDDLANAPSDFIVLVNREMQDHGFARFGVRGYGDKVMAWLLENYTAVRVFGAPYEQTSKAGVTILQRNKRS